MSWYLIYVTLVVAHQCVVKANSLAIDFDSLDEDGKAKINDLYEKYGDYNGLEANLKTDNEADCNSKKDIYADAIDSFVKDKGEEAATTVEVSGKEFSLPVFKKGTKCVQQTNAISLKNWLNNLRQGDLLNNAKGRLAEVQQREDVKQFLVKYDSYKAKAGAKAGELAANNPELTNSIEEIRRVTTNPKSSVSDITTVLQSQAGNIWNQASSLVKSQLTAGKAAAGGGVKAEAGPAAETEGSKTTDEAAADIPVE